jgi:phenylacetate-CoA ligase
VTVHPAINEVGADRHAAVGALVERARARVPFYRHHHAGVRSSELAAQPTCTKADLAGWGRFPLSAVPFGALHRVSATSGTTGPRLFVGYTVADWDDVGAQCARMGAHAGLGPGDTLLNLLGGGLWVGGPCFDLLARVTGANLLPAGPTNPAQVFEWMADLPITALTCTPSYLRLVHETAAVEGVDLSAWPLRLAFVGGEPATPALRAQVSPAMPGGFRWVETYGSTEVGGAVLGYAPPDDPLCGELNIATDTFVVELLHPDRDEPVAPGEVGELTVTTFREASPLIRYRTRDLVREVDTLRDRSGLPRTTAVAARIDDAIKVRGALVYPGVIEEVLVANLAPGAEWRIELSRDAAALDVLTVRVEHADDSLCPALTEVLQHRLLVRPVVEAVPPGSFERFGGKAKRVEDRRPTD